MDDVKITKIVKDLIRQEKLSTPIQRSGVILNYYPIDNTADILLSNTLSDQPQDVLSRVPCPTSIGIQQAAPEPGRGCWVVFDGIGQNKPYVISIHNPHYTFYDYERQTHAYNSIPNFLTE